MEYLLCVCPISHCNECICKKFLQQLFIIKVALNQSQLMVYHTILSKRPLPDKHHCTNFKGSMLQLPYKCMQFISWVSVHEGQKKNSELCLSTHGRLCHVGHYSTLEKRAFLTYHCSQSQRLSLFLSIWVCLSVALSPGPFPGF